MPGEWWEQPAASDATATDSANAAAQLEDFYSLYKRTRTVTDVLGGVAAVDGLPVSIFNAHVALVHEFSQIFESVPQVVSESDEWEIRMWLVGFDSQADRIRQGTLGVFPLLIPVVLIVAGATVTFFVAKELIDRVATYRERLSAQEQQAAALRTLWGKVEAGTLSVDQARTLAEQVPDAPTEPAQAGIFATVDSIVKNLGVLAAIGLAIWVVGKFPSGGRGGE